MKASFKPHCEIQYGVAYMSLSFHHSFSVGIYIFIMWPMPLSFSPATHIQGLAYKC